MERVGQQFSWDHSPSMALFSKVDIKSQINIILLRRKLGGTKVKN